MTNAPETINIVFVNAITTGKDTYDEKKRTIYWDPKAGLVLGNKTHIMSAALGLAHEMGHAAQHLSREYDEIFDAMINNKPISKEQILMLEEANLAKYETPIAQELGEYTRANYGDAKRMHRMKSSTDWGTLNPWYYTWAPWLESYENQNTWTPAQK